MSQMLAVTSRSNDVIDALAAECRRAAGFCDPAPQILDLVRMAASKFPHTAALEIVQVPDGSLGGDEARAVSVPPRIFITRSVHTSAERNEPRARFTLAHEFGHVFLGHKGGERPRNATAVKVREIKPYEDAEHQANRFASVFLVPESNESVGLTAAELQLRFRISQQAAEIRFQQLTSRMPKSTPQHVLEGIAILREISSDQGRRRLVGKSLLPDDIRKKLAWECLDVCVDQDPAQVRLVENRWFIRFQLFQRSCPGGWRLVDDKVVAWEDESTL